MRYAYAQKLVKRRAEQQMLSAITIYRGSLGEMDSNTLEVTGVTNTAVIYVGKARLHPIQPAGNPNVGQAVLDLKTVQISIPVGANDDPVPRRDDLILINDDNEFNTENRWFRVLEIDSSGFFNAFRTMICQTFYENRYWG